MKLDLTPMRSGYVEPTFGTEDRKPLDPRLEHRLRQPMRIGAAVIGAFVVGLGVLFSFVPLPSEQASESFGAIVLSSVCCRRTRVTSYDGSSNDSPAPPVPDVGVVTSVGPHATSNMHAMKRKEPMKQWCTRTHALPT